MIVPLAFALDFLRYRRKQMRIRPGVILSVFIGCFLGLWQFLIFRAVSLGGRVDIREPLWWMVFIISLFVLYHWLCCILTQVFLLNPKWSELLESPRGWWLRTLRMWVALVLFTPYLYTATNIHRFKTANNTDPMKAHNIPFEAVTFPALDGTPLSGWYMPAKGASATVLICHGISANKGNFLQFAPFLHKAGFNVFIFDQRGHGDSPGHTVTFGYNEALDVRGAVEYLKQRPDTKNILGYGFSMGGSSLLHAMPELKDVRGVVVDSTFADMTTLGREQVAFLPAPIGSVLMQAVAFWTRIEVGIPLAEIAPRRHIGVISPRPLLIIHGAADGLIPPSQAEANFAAAGEPKELWLVPGANHIGPMAARPEEYQRRVVQFFKRCVAFPGVPR